MSVATTEQETRAGEKGAWDEYLGCTRGLDKERYEKVEPYAWKILKGRLRKLGVKVHG